MQYSTWQMSSTLAGSSISWRRSSIRSSPRLTPADIVRLLENLCSNVLSSRRLTENGSHAWRSSGIGPWTRPVEYGIRQRVSNRDVAENAPSRACWRYGSQCCSIDQNYGLCTGYEGVPVAFVSAAKTRCVENVPAYRTLSEAAVLLIAGVITIAMERRDIYLKKVEVGKEMQVKRRRQTQNRSAHQKRQTLDRKEERRAYI